MFTWSLIVEFRRLETLPILFIQGVMNIPFFGESGPALRLFLLQHTEGVGLRYTPDRDGIPQPVGARDETPVRQRSPGRERQDDKREQRDGSSGVDSNAWRAITGVMEAGAMGRDLPRNYRTDRP